MGLYKEILWTGLANLVFYDRINNDFINTFKYI
jgi:hypothetical protein